jgi:hypothetical protein
MRSWTCLIFVLLAPGSQAFAPHTPAAVSKLQQPSTALFMSETKNKKKGGVDESLRNKLLAESIAPWRTLRLFLYGSMGSGAAVGGFITLAGTLAAVSGARTDVDLNTEVSK